MFLAPSNRTEQESNSNSAGQRPERLCQHVSHARGLGNQAPQFVEDRALRVRLVVDLMSAVRRNKIPASDKRRTSCCTAPSPIPTAGQVDGDRWPRPGGQAGRPRPGGGPCQTTLRRGNWCGRMYSFLVQMYLILEQNASHLWDCQTLTGAVECRCPNRPAPLPSEHHVQRICRTFDLQRRGLSGP